MRIPVSAALITLFLLSVSAMAQQNPARDLPRPEPPANSDQLGAGIQRPMTLMATSTPERRNTVKVLYYGQSITNQQWTDQVSEHLRQTYSHADLQFEKLSLGGFASQRLVRTTDYDVLPYYPDLLVFHVLGDHRRYEDIIIKVRQKTTAQIAIWNDHITRLPTSPDDWSEQMSYKFIPSYAERYGCYLMDIRTPWKEYLLKHGFEPKKFLRDGVHLNDNGNWLLATLINDRLLYNPKLPRDWQDLVRDYAVGEDVEWQDGRLKLEFTGNRVDVVSAWTGGGEPGHAKVLIDGKAPSEHPEVYYHARPTGTPHIGWPAIKRIGHRVPLLQEQWTARVWGFNEDATDFQFEVTGSVTGPDGRGRGAETFVSESGRVVIEPQDWTYDYDWSLAQRRNDAPRLPQEHVVRWQTRAIAEDTYAPEKVEDPSMTYATVLAQGLQNARHTLELLSSFGGPMPIGAIRVYEPPLKQVEPLHGQPVQ